MYHCKFCGRNNNKFDEYMFASGPVQSESWIVSFYPSRLIVCLSPPIYVPIKSGLLQSLFSLPIVCFPISLVSGHHWQEIGVREKTEAPLMRSHPSMSPD